VFYFPPHCISSPHATSLYLCRQKKEKEWESSGGLGAALSQYSISNEEDMPWKDQSTTLMKRKSSGGNLTISSQNRSKSFSNERFRAASPMINSSRFQFQERIGSPMFFSSAGAIPLVDPPGTLRSDNVEAVEVSRLRPYQTFVPRDGSGSLSTLPPTTYHPVGSVHRGKVSR
jgi:hypothetical protein